MANIAVPTSSRTKSVFTYDGMKYQGYSQRLEGNVDELIAGTSPSCPPGFHTHSVVYKLKGGLKAQQLFKNRQIANAMQTLQLQLDTSPGPILRSPHWVKTSAIDTHHHCSNSTVEYHLSKPGPHLPSAEISSSPPPPSPLSICCRCGLYTHSLSHYASNGQASSP
ncbi:hypothetical protein FB446DRAFT_795647 [Lentinula raphanica]|nr:hypothetical protein FB446DRAFT_795647 [Lentinula raphanica]